MPIALEPTFSAREAAAILGRSYSWIDQRLRAGEFIDPDGDDTSPATNTRELPDVRCGDTQRDCVLLLSARLVQDGQSQVQPPAAGCSCLPRDRGGPELRLLSHE